MNDKINTKTKYKPIQPTVAHSENIIYHEVEPSQDIARYIFCYWQLYSTQELNTDFHYRVIADGCIDVFFNMQDPSESLVMGFCKHFEKFELGKIFSYAGIRFNPSYFSQIFKLDAKVLSNRVTALRKVCESLSTYISENITGQEDLSQIKENFDSFLGDWIDQTSFLEDERFYNALNVIYDKNGLVETENGLKTGLSPRQLRRVFNYYIGTSPKSFSKVVRFQSIIHKIHNASSTLDSSVYLDAGFFDQAHFIKEFKNYYGVTPSEVYV